MKWLVVAPILFIVAVGCSKQPVEGTWQRTTPQSGTGWNFKLIETRIIESDQMTAKTQCVLEQTGKDTENVESSVSSSIEITEAKITIDEGNNDSNTMTAVSYDCEAKLEKGAIPYKIKETEGEEGEEGETLTLDGEEYKRVD